MDEQALLKQGIAAAKEGRNAEAWRLLDQALRQNQRNELAWLWLSRVVDSQEQQIKCLENVLAINPHNTVARETLDELQPPAMPAAHASPAPGPAGSESLLAHCPHCGAESNPGARFCEQCGQNLATPDPQDQVEVQGLQSRDDNFAIPPAPEPSPARAFLSPDPQATTSTEPARPGNQSSTVSKQPGTPKALIIAVSLLGVVSCLMVGGVVACLGIRMLFFNDGGLEHTFKGDGFSIGYSKDWDHSPAQFGGSRGAITFSESGRAVGSGVGQTNAAQITVAWGDDEGKTPQEQCEALAGAGGLLNRSTKGQEGSIKIDGHRGYEVTFDITPLLSLGPATTTTFYVAVLEYGSDQMVAFISLSPGDQWREYWPIFKTMRDSIRF